MREDDDFNSRIIVFNCNENEFKSLDFEAEFNSILRRYDFSSKIVVSSKVFYGEEQKIQRLRNELTFQKGKLSSLKDKLSHLDQDNDYGGADHRDKGLRTELVKTIKKVESVISRENRLYLNLKEEQGVEESKGVGLIQVGNIRDRNSILKAFRKKKKWSFVNCCRKRSRIDYNLEAAPDLTNIEWKNIGISQTTITSTRIMIYLSSLVFVGLIRYLINFIQDLKTHRYAEQAQNQILAGLKEEES